MEAALLHADQGVELGQNDRCQPEDTGQLDSGDRPVTRQDPLELAEDPLRGHVRQPRRARQSRIPRRRVGLEAELTDVPDQAQGPQRIGLESSGRRQPESARRDIPDPAERVDQASSGERLGRSHSP